MPTLKAEALRETEVAIRQTIAEEDLFKLLNESDDFLIEVVDYWISQLYETQDDEEAFREVSNLFDKSGSSLRVSTMGDFAHLEERVDPTVTAAAIEATIENAKRPGKHLARAWTAVYGRHPDPGKAYAESVRAVESAAIPVFLPGDKTATLGKVIGQLKARKAHVNSVLTPNSVIPGEVLIAMMSLIWQSQWDRHGIPDDAVALNVSREEAEAALHLATTLTHWLTTGAFKIQATQASRL